MRPFVPLFVAGIALASGEARGQVVAGPSTAETDPPPASAEPSSAPRGVVVSGVGAADAGDRLRYPPSSVRLPLVLGGLGFTLATYGGAVGMGAAFDDAQVPGADSLVIPIAGPFIALGRIGCSPLERDSCGELNALRGILYVLDGLAQLGGLGIAAEGLFATTEAVVPTRSAGVTIAPVPILNGEVQGVGLVGSF